MSQEPGRRQADVDPASHAETGRFDAPGADDGDGGVPAATSVLDRPPDERDLGEQLRRTGTARSTRVLLALLAAVVVFGVGALVGRASAPDTGPGSAAPIAGTLESVDSSRGFPQLTVRGPDGSLTTLRTSGGTVVAVPQGGPADLVAGQQVTVASEREADGALTVTRVDLPPGQ